jgi:hypothetical protein
MFCLIWRRRFSKILDETKFTILLIRETEIGEISDDAHVYDIWP